MNFELHFIIFTLVPSWIYIYLSTDKQRLLSILGNITSILIWHVPAHVNSSELGFSPPVKLTHITIFILTARIFNQSFRNLHTYMSAMQVIFFFFVGLKHSSTSLGNSVSVKHCYWRGSATAAASAICKLFLIFAKIWKDFLFGSLI